MNLSQLFENYRDIVINTDIDGFLCGMILQKYYGCRVVGFSNSKETVWLDPAVRSIDDPVYIDLYVAARRYSVSSSIPSPTTAPTTNTSAAWAQNSIPTSTAAVHSAATSPATTSTNTPSAPANTWYISWLWKAST